MEFLLFLILIVLIFSDSDSEPKNDKEPTYLHQHWDLGWHAHPYERNHVHRRNNLNGPFHYVDERVIDQRRGR